MSSAKYPSLQGKRVVVTGGATGIGEAMVEAFASQGARVDFLDILEAEGGALEARHEAATACRFHLCDLRDLAEVEATFARIGPIDILVNNAANDDRHDLKDITPEYWDDRMAVNLRHLLFCTKAVVPGMRAAGGGAIINLGSISWHLGLPGLALYETAKAGIEGMTRALARELGPDNIRVTAIVPGNVKTPRQERWYSAEEEQEIVSQQCLPVRLHPEHVARLALFLASDDGALCTGHEYWIDGGWR